MKWLKIWVESKYSGYHKIASTFFYWKPGSATELAALIQYYLDFNFLFFRKMRIILLGSIHNYSICSASTNVYDLFIITSYRCAKIFAPMQLSFLQLAVTDDAFQLPPMILFFYPISSKFFFLFFWHYFQFFTISFIHKVIVWVLIVLILFYFKVFWAC